MMAGKSQRDIEKSYTPQQMVAKLRRLADCLEQNKPFRIQIAGERISIPAHAVFNIEHERGGRAEEVEFQFKWTLD
jgi:amphi-Trp domain-containing protein